MSRLTHGPTIIAPIDPVMILLPMSKFQVSCRRRGLRMGCALLMSAHKETKDLTCRSEHMDYYVILMDHLANLSEAVLGLRSAQDAHIPMDLEGW